MPNWSNGFSWWESEAHLLLLSQFSEPRRVSDTLFSAGWAAALDESPQQALRRASIR